MDWLASSLPQEIRPSTHMNGRPDRVWQPHHSCLFLSALLTQVKGRSDGCQEISGKDWPAREKRELLGPLFVF